jgi:cytochrome P450
MQDTTILGKFIPKGSTIYVPLATINGMPGYQANNDELRSESSKAAKDIPAWDPNTVHQFQPSRWLVDGQFDSRAGPWMPFSLGPRGCFGRALAVRRSLQPFSQMPR